MKNIKLKLSAVVLSAMFVSIPAIAFEQIDTGLGKDLGGAVINDITGGYAGSSKGDNSFNMNFNGNSHVNWDTLNIGQGESLNFNTVGGANGLTILNTVNKGMTQVYGQINADGGIGKIIIANPNGMLFDGSSFTTAGDVMLTTKDLSAVKVEDLGNTNFSDAKYNNIYNTDGNIIAIRIQNGAEFNVGGEYSIIAPAIDVAASTLNAKSIKMVTSNGQDYLALGKPNSDTMYPGVRLQAVEINGDVYIEAPTGSVRTENGGTLAAERSF